MSLTALRILARAFGLTTESVTPGGPKALTSSEPVSYRVGDTEGVAMSAPQSGHPAHDHVPAPDEPSVPELEEDENIAPRPEEEIADILRAEPDVEDHSRMS